MGLIVERVENGSQQSKKHDTGRSKTGLGDMSKVSAMRSSVEKNGGKGVVAVVLGVKGERDEKV